MPSSHSILFTTPHPPLLLPSLFSTLLSLGREDLAPPHPTPHPTPPAHIYCGGGSWGPACRGCPPGLSQCRYTLAIQPPQSDPTMMLWGIRLCCTVHAAESANVLLSPPSPSHHHTSLRIARGMSCSSSGVMIWTPQPQPPPAQTHEVLALGSRGVGLTASFTPTACGAKLTPSRRIQKSGIYVYGSLHFVFPVSCLPRLPITHLRRYTLTSACSPNGQPSDPLAQWGGSKTSCRWTAG